MRSEARQLLWMALGSLSLAACSGTGDGGGGDPLSVPAANPYGNGSRISELVGYADWEDPSDERSALCLVSDSPPPAPPPADRLVAIDGATVTAVDRFDETGDGAVGNTYIQDSTYWNVPPELSEPAVPYSGMTIYDPSFTPPDLRVVPGDVVDMYGVLMEFVGPSVGNFPYCRTLPEIGGTMGFRFEAVSPPPVVIQVRQLVDYQDMRKWLGMLVKIENVGLADDPYEAAGRYSIRLDVGGGVNLQDVPTIANELYDLANSGLTFAAGDTLTSVTGIVTYFYGVHISPRSIDDIVL